MSPFYYPTKIDVLFAGFVVNLIGNEFAILFASLFSVLSKISGLNIKEYN